MAPSLCAEHLGLSPPPSPQTSCKRQARCDSNSVTQSVVLVFQVNCCRIDLWVLIRTFINKIMNTIFLCRKVHKGINPDVDSYSAFFDNQKLSKTCLEEIIRNENVSDLFVCGIATDVCVGNAMSQKCELGTDRLD